MTDYGSMSYWDERYAAEDTEYDWYQEFGTIKSYLMPHLTISSDFEILIPGCGNSSKYYFFLNSGLILFRIRSGNLRFRHPKYYLC